MYRRTHRKELDLRTHALLVILDSMQSQSIVPRPGNRNPDRIHFAWDAKPKKGDLVMSTSSGFHPWTVGWFVEPLSDGGVVRGLGTDRECRITNDKLVVIHIPPRCETYFYGGDQRRMFEWADKAFTKRWNRQPMPEGKEWPLGASFDIALSRVLVEPHKVIQLVVRCHCWSATKHTEDGQRLEAVPYTLEMPWTKKTRLKDICDFVNANIRPFEYV